MDVLFTFVMHSSMLVGVLQILSYIFMSGIHAFVIKVDPLVVFFSSSLLTRRYIKHKSKV